MEKIKIDEWDRRTYYPMSFNEQMAWIDEEVEYLVNDRDKTHKQLNEIRAMGKETYGTINTETAGNLDFSGLPAFFVTNLLLVQCSI